MKFLLRLTAHLYETINGALVTTCTHTDKLIVEVEGFAQADAAVAAFGRLHAPCSVWVACASPKKPRGFDDPAAHLFPVAQPGAVLAVISPAIADAFGMRGLPNTVVAV